MAEMGKLVAVVGAKTDAFGKGMDGVDKRLGTTQGKFGKFGNKVGGAMKVGGLAAVGFGVAIAGMAVKSAIDIGKLESQITAGTGATGDALEGLKDVFKDVAGSVASSGADVAGIVTELNTRIGATGDPLKTLTTNLAEVSRMLGEDATEATVRYTQAMNRWEVPMEEAPAFLDKLFKASQETGMGVGKLGQLMAEFGSILKNADYTIEESMALFGGLAKAGIPITRIMPAINMATRKFAEEGINLKEGLTGAFDAIKNATSASEALAIATGTFGAEGAQRLSDAIRSGDLELGELVTTLENAEGAVKEFSEATKDPATRFAELKNKVMMCLSSLGEKLMPVIFAVVEALSSLIEVLPIEPIAELIKTAIEPLAAALRPIFSEVLPPLISILSSALIPVFQAVVKIIQPIVSKLLPPLVRIITALLSILSPLIEIGLEPIVEILGIWIELIAPIIDLLADLIEMAVKPLTAAFKFLQEKALKPVLGVFKSLGGVAKKVIGFIVGLFQDFPDKIKRALTVLKDIFAAPFNFLMSIIEKALNWIIRQVNKISVTVPSWVPFIGGKTFGFDIPEISLPKLEKGGIVPGSLGEAVPILAHGGELVLTPEQYRGLGGINVYIYGSWSIREELDIKKVAFELGEEFELKLRLQGA